MAEPNGFMLLMPIPGIDMLKEAIEYAIRQNQLEGLETSEETKALLDRVARGDLTIEQLLKIFDAKARKYAEK